MDNKNKKIVYIVVAVVILVIVFGAGYLLGKSSSGPARIGNPPTGNFQDMNGQSQNNRDNTNSGNNQNQNMVPSNNR